MTQKSKNIEPTAHLYRFDEVSGLVPSQIIFQLLFDEIEKNNKFSEGILHFLPDTILVDHVLQRKGTAILCYDHPKGIRYGKTTTRGAKKEDEKGYYGNPRGEIQGWHIGNLPSHVPIPLEDIVTVAPDIIPHYWGKSFHALPDAVKEKAYIIFPPDDKIWPACVLVWDYAFVADHYIKAYTHNDLAFALAKLHEKSQQPEEQDDEEDVFPEYRQSKYK